MSKRENNDVQSVERAFRILDLLRDGGGSMAVGEIAHALDLSPSTAHRLLATLKKCRAVQQDPHDRRYSLALHIVLYGKAILDRFDLRERCHPLLGELSREAGETVFMSILDEYQVVYIDHVDSLDHTLRLTPQIGLRQYAHTTAMGKVLLAHLEPQRLEEYLSTHTLIKRTENSITDPRMLRQELEKVRRQGYAIDRQESEVGICCVAAPIRELSGRVAAAISISGPGERMQQKGLETALTERIMATAERMSEMAGASH
jgi:IclR family acetate operon transcriptional repressor